MDKILKFLQPEMLKFMRSRYTETETRKRWNKTVKMYYKWLREEGDFGGKANLMSSNITICYAMCAFYEAVDRNFSKEDFNKLYLNTMSKKFSIFNKIDMNKYENKKWFINLINSVLRRYKAKADKKRGNEWGNTWELRVNPHNHKKGFAFVLDTCPLYEFAQKYGYMDFLPIMCASDHLMAKQFHAKLIRHSTLSAGDGKCDYWYVGDKSPEALNDKGSK